MKNLNEMTIAELTATYNELSGKSVKKVDSKAKGIAKIEKLIAEQAPKKPAKPAKVKKVKTEGERKIAEADAERQGKVLELLRKGEHSIKGLQAIFNTTYKNITGNLFYIRKGKGETMVEGEELVRRREGMTSFYSIVEAA